MRVLRLNGLSPVNGSKGFLRPSEDDVAGILEG